MHCACACVCGIGRSIGRRGRGNRRTAACARTLTTRPAARPPPHAQGGLAALARRAAAAASDAPADADGADAALPPAPPASLAGGRIPLFLVPGVTLSVRSADGAVLRLRPGFLSLQQLAAAAALGRDVAVAAWRRRRAAERWRLVAALDVLTVHGAGGLALRCLGWGFAGKRGAGLRVEAGCGRGVAALRLPLTTPSLHPAPRTLPVCHVN